MKLVLVDEPSPDFVEIEGIIYVSTLSVSDYLKLSNNHKFDEFQKGYITGLELAELSVHASFTNPEKLESLLAMLDLAREISSDLNKNIFINNALRESIIRNWHGTLPNEQDVYVWFEENYKSILGENFVISDKKSERKHRPDFWLSNQETELMYPVEIKLYGFEEKSLQQLERYMNHYGCSQGIAVGSELKCQLPQSISYINHTLKAKRR